MSASWYDDFLDFQAAIARAVSMSWNDPDFRARLLRPCGALQAMKEASDYDRQFDLTMSVREDDDGHQKGPDRFEPIYTGGWIGDGDLIRFNLPPAPRDPKQRAEALAAFN